MRNSKSLLLLMSTVTLLSMPMKAEERNVKADAGQYTIDTDVGDNPCTPIVLRPVHTLDVTIMEENVKPCGCPPYLLVNSSTKAKSTVAPCAAQIEPSPCATGLLRPGWRA